MNSVLPQQIQFQSQFLMMLLSLLFLNLQLQTTTTTTLSFVSSFSIPQPRLPAKNIQWSTTISCPTTSSSALYGGFLNDFFNEGKKALMKNLAGDYDVEATRQQINTYIETNPVVLMFSFETCPYCVKAKAILDSKNIPYTNIDLRKDVTDGKAIRAELGTMIGRTSVPAIWINRQYIGGCNDGGPNNGGINALNESGQLDTLLQQAIAAAAAAGS